MNPKNCCEDTTPTLVVMAAGMGSRYGGLKQLEGVGPNGETLLEYSIFDALRAGFGRVVFVIRKDIEAVFREVVLSRFEDKVTYALAYQELDALPVGFKPPVGRTKPWGTGQAVLAARDLVRGPFAVINADDYYGPGAYKSLCAFFASNTSAGNYALAAYRLDNTLSPYGTVSRGVCSLDAQGRLRGVEEVTAIGWQGERGARRIAAGERVFEGDERVSMNLWGFTPLLFEQLSSGFTAFLKARGTEEKSEYYLPTCVSEAIAANQAQVSVLPVDDKWYGVTYREDRPEVVEALAEAHALGLYPERLWA